MKLTKILSLEEFCKAIKIIDNSVFRKEIIQKYEMNFLNYSTAKYSKQILELKEFSDGLCYTGYMWDYLINPRIISFNQFAEKLKKKKTKLKVFWDIHSKDRILIKNYWKFKKEAILELNPEQLFKGLTFLPEDIYICDETFTWTLILTHEHLEQERYCLEMKTFK